jgi:DNA-binding transcriptional MerR regulator
MKRAGGRRLYRVDDMALLRGLKTLLHDDGYTIKGVQKLLKDNGVAWVREAGEGVPACSVTQPVPVETEQVAPTSPAASQPVSVTHDRPRPDSARLQAVLARLQAANRRIEDVLAA